MRIVQREARKDLLLKCQSMRAHRARWPLLPLRRCVPSSFRARPLVSSPPPPRTTAMPSRTNPSHRPPRDPHRSGHRISTRRPEPQLPLPSPFTNQISSCSRYSLQPRQQPLCTSCTQPQRSVPALHLPSQSLLLLLQPQTSRRRLRSLLRCRSMCSTDTWRAKHSHKLRASTSGSQRRRIPSSLGIR